MITYRKHPSLRVRRREVPEPPFFERTSASLYGVAPADRLAIDYLAGLATAAVRSDVAVCDRAGYLLEHEASLEGPLLIEATGFAEQLFRQGEAAAVMAGSSNIDSTLLISADGAVPERTTGPVTLAIATWPLPAGGRLSARGLRRSDAESHIEQTFVDAAAWPGPWGAVIPVVPHAATDLTLLGEIISHAAKCGASFVISVAIDPDPAARSALAARAIADDPSDEAWAAAFDEPTETLVLATQRHIAALTIEAGIADSLPLGGTDVNWKAAALLTTTASRMIELERDVELAWELHRSAGIIARLRQSLEVIHSAAPLSIIEGLDEVSLDMVEEWLEHGRARFADQIDAVWRLRRDHYR